MRSRPIAVDLFAGAGGMSLGFEQAGFDVVAALELDPAHAGVHRFNFPRCAVVRADAASVDGDRLRHAAREGLRAHARATGRLVIDVVFGGPPCQGFSVGGLLDPHDPRNRLVAEFVRLVTELRPRAFVMENVPAMATRTLPGDSAVLPDWIQQRLGRAGYAVAKPVVLNASHFGVPQDRRRLVIVGVLDRVEPPPLPSVSTAAWPKAPGRRPRAGEVGHRDTAPELPAGPTVHDALADLPDVDRFEALLATDEVSLPRSVRQVMAAKASSYAQRLGNPEIDDLDLSWPRRHVSSLLTSSLRTVHAPEVVDRFAATEPGEREPISRFVRLHGDGVSPTLRAGSTPDRGSFSAPRPIHPSWNRVISVREAARLQGFPDWFRFSVAKWHGFRQVGNSVPPPLARAIAETLRRALDLPGERPTERLALGHPSLLRVPSGSGRAAAARARQAA